MAYWGRAKLIGSQPRGRESPGPVVDPGNPLRPILLPGGPSFTFHPPFSPPGLR